MAAKGESKDSTKSPKTPEMITVSSYLRPITELDDEAVEKLKTLLKITKDLRSHTSQAHRIQRGSPGAGQLGTALSSTKSEVQKITATLRELFDCHDQFPGMHLLRVQFKTFLDTLNQPFNDGGNDPGYNERVHFLERLMYVSGNLQGQVEVILEQYSYWKAKIAGEEPPCVARRLDFDQPQVQTQPASNVTFGQLATGVGNINLGLSPQVPQNANVGVQIPPLRPMAVALNMSTPIQVVAQRDMQQTSTSPPPNPCSSPKGTISVSINLLEHLRSGIISLWESRDHSDVTLVVAGTRIPTHRVILASQSEYFDRLLFGEMREAHAGAEIPLPDTPLEAFQLLLQYAYCGSLEMKTAQLRDILEVVVLADRYSFVLLKEALGEQLSRHIGETNVLEVFVHADMCHLPQLQEKCLKFVDGNADRVLKSNAFLSLPEDNLKDVISRDTFIAPEVSVFQAVLQWKEHNKQSRKEMEEILKCVRLSEISPQDLFAVVEPCNLFQEPSILRAIRIQVKPELEQMQPRGKKVPGKNQLKFVTTVEPHQVIINYPHQKQQLGSPPQSITEGVVQLGVVQLGVVQLGMVQPETVAQPVSDGGGLQQVYGGYGGGLQLAAGFGGGGLFGRQPYGSGLQLGDRACTNLPTTCTISLNDVYLLNELQLTGYPDLPPQEKSFSYTIKVSKDKKAWLQLFNYSRVSCFGRQNLCFPTQAVRYIQFELTGRSNMKQVFTVRFLTCHFSEHQKPFRFRENGVIAPLSPFQPQLTQSEYSRKDGQPACLVTFFQPYSISQLRFKVRYLQSTKGDITVLVSTLKEEDSFEKLMELKNKEFGTEITVEFPERVVSYVMVAAKPEAKMQGIKLATQPKGTGVPVQPTGQVTTLPPAQTVQSTPPTQSPLFGQLSFSTIPVSQPLLVRQPLHGSQPTQPARLQAQPTQPPQLQAQPTQPARLQPQQQTPVVSVDGLTCQTIDVPTDY